MTKFLILLLLCSCAGHLKMSSFASKNESEPMNRDQAKKKIFQEHNFLKMLYEQSRDPYYGTPKWSEECLKETIIRPVKESPDMIHFHADFYVNEQGRSGACPGDLAARKICQIMIYCENQKSLQVYRLPYNKELEERIHEVNFCE